MKTLAPLPILIVLASLYGSPALGAGDSVVGEKLAKEHCARCHDIGPSGAPKQYPPSFASIAAYRSEEQIYTRIISPAIHSTMPEVAQSLLQSNDVKDLVAYIMSLEK